MTTTVLGRLRRGATQHPADDPFSTLIPQEDRILALIGRRVHQPRDRGATLDEREDNQELRLADLRKAARGATSTNCAARDRASTPPTANVLATPSAIDFEFQVACIELDEHVRGIARLLKVRQSQRSTPASRVLRPCLTSDPAAIKNTCGFPSTNWRHSTSATWSSKHCVTAKCSERTLWTTSSTWSTGRTLAAPTVRRSRCCGCSMMRHNDTRTGNYRSAATRTSACLCSSRFTPGVPPSTSELKATDATPRGGRRSSRSMCARTLPPQRLAAG
jgi:hypothetical protein